VEGVVHALRRIHRSLRDHGVLLDVHPQPENSLLEVWQGSGVTRLGKIDQEQDIREILESRACLATLESDGMFATSERRFFDLLEHYENAQDWLERWARKGWAFEVSNELLESANKLLADGGGELIIREPVRATVLKRV
jgi:hypothetical protein